MTTQAAHPVGGTIAAGRPALPARRFAPVIAAMLAGAALVWAYWPVIASMARDWRTDDDYSAGQLVPLAAVLLVWLRRRELFNCPLEPCWSGLGLVLAGQVMNFFGLAFLYEAVQRYSMILAVAGLVLLLAGTGIFRKLSWIIIFLALMVPLPGMVHNIISGPLQTLAAAGTEFSLEVLGIPAIREGHVLLLDGVKPLGVDEACSGLRLLTAFMLVSGALALLVRRPKWQKVVLAVSSIPIAVACNLVRLCVMALVSVRDPTGAISTSLHDVTGWGMMPLALACLAGELWVMRRLTQPGAKNQDRKEAKPQACVAGSAKFEPASLACGKGEGR